MEEKNKNYSSLEGKFLIASPNISDPRFSQTLIYMISDSINGSMGLIVNRPAINVNLKNIFLILKVLILKKIKNIQFTMAGLLNLIKDLYCTPMIIKQMRKKLF